MAHSIGGSPHTLLGLAPCAGPGFPQLFLNLLLGLWILRVFFCWFQVQAVRLDRIQESIKFNPLTVPKKKMGREPIPIALHPQFQDTSP